MHYFYATLLKVVCNPLTINYHVKREFYETVHESIDGTTQKWIFKKFIPVIYTNDLATQFDSDRFTIIFYMIILCEVKIN